MLRTINIKARLLIAFSLMILLLIGLSGLSISSMKTIRHNANTVETNLLPSIMSLGELNANLMRVRISTLRLLQSDTQESRQQSVDSIREIQQEVDKYSREYESLISIDEERQIYSAFNKARNSYYEELEKLIASAMAGQLEDAKGTLPQLYSIADVLVKELRELVAINKKFSDETRLASIAEYDSNFWLVIFTVIIASIIAIVISFMLSNSINQPLQAAVNAAEVIAQAGRDHTLLTNGNF
ncbi:MCP four helix bundle domain-containing protein [Shewanella profunda]|uniref:MCP four helix bundle domain-containing protein n=1 Tax=Shewanella profunda TaxID=254793 RepID=UPI00200C4409|nr:MCP four helix bundle domain-containing protein [Shewanella profunda]MCL1089659.1 MCP four helix bundle domain-containing protein [Shewanella profunda]